MSFGQVWASPNNPDGEFNSSDVNSWRGALGEKIADNSTLVPGTMDLKLCLRLDWIRYITLFTLL